MRQPQNTLFTSQPRSKWTLLNSGTSKFITPAIVETCIVDYLGYIIGGSNKKSQTVVSTVDCLANKQLIRFYNDKESTK